MFRWPKETTFDNFRFYQETYSEGAVTDLPDPEALANAETSNFRGGLLDYSLRINVARRLKAGGRILDYGASWGYGVRQFSTAGYDAAGFEISAPRAEYGRSKLGVRIETDIRTFSEGEFDLIHTAHVLEHIPDLHGPFDEFRRLLKPDGMLMIFVPNASGKLARDLGTSWGPLIGEKHVLALTAEFFARNLPSFGFSPSFDSSPFSEPPRRWEDRPSLDGEELLVIARRL